MNLMVFKREIKRFYYFLKYSSKTISIEVDTNIEIGAVLNTVGGGSIEIGNNCTIHKGAMILSYGGDIKIGNYCSINPYCVLYGHGGLSIGNGVRIAAHTVIIPANHNFDSIENFIYEQGETSLGIIIEDDVWIGTGARILDGVTIAKGSIIGAGAVVKKNTQKYGIYAGVPAKLIRFRGEINKPSLKWDSP